MKKKLLTLLLGTLTLTACTPDDLNWWDNASPDDQDAMTIAIINNAAHEFGVDPNLMVRIARCESGLRWWKKNPSSTASGLFQYLNTTWERARWRLYERGIDQRPYEEWDKWDPIAASRITANVISEGGLSWWNESRRCWAR